MRRKKLSAEFKAEVALDALTRSETTSRLAEKHGVHPTTITRWKAKAQKGMVDVFRAGSSPVNSCPVFQEHGHVESAIRHGRDITTQMRSGHKSRDTEKLAKLGRLEADVVHEINNSLGIVLCYAQLLLKDIPAGDPIARDVAVIERHAQNCKRIVMDLLQCARGRESLMPLPIPLHPSQDQE